MICPDAVKALINQFCYGYANTYYLVWNADALAPRVKKKMPYVIFKILSAEINYDHWT